MGSSAGGEVMLTVASSLSLPVLPTESTTVAVTTSVWLAPALPLNTTEKPQLYVPPGPSTAPVAVLQLEPALVVRSP